MPTPASSNTLVDRVSLRNLIDASRRLDELGIARIIANVAEVVHKQQKGGQPIHKVTPDAIVVTSDGDVNLHLTEGRAGYTAPERLRGENGDRRSDVFSLGAVLWEALAHEPLFQGEVEGEIKAAVLEGEYRSASETNANVPAELDAICKKALSKSPADRFPSCKVMAAEIATVLDDADYPEDNAAIAEYIATKYVPPAPKAEPQPTSRPTPLPVEAAPPSPVQTLQGISPRAEIDAAIAKVAAEKVAEVKPPVLPVEAPRAKTPTGPKVKEATHEPATGLPSWATGRPASPSTPPETKSSETLPGMPTILNAPPAPEPARPFSKTQVLGSLSSSDLAPGAFEKVEPSEVAEPSQPTPIGKKTETHGSQSIAERLAAINSAAPSLAGLPSVPPGADPVPFKSITTAETLPTPALAGYAKAEASAAAALDAVHKTPTPSDAVAMAAAATGAGESTPAVHPASVVALPRPRSQSEAGRTRGDPTGSGDPVGNWGWGTDSHPAIGLHDDDDFHDQQRATKKRLVFAIGGAAGVLVLVIVAAFAFGGGNNEKKDVAAKQAEPPPAVDWSQPTDPPPAAPVVDPSAGSGSAVEANAGSADAVTAADPATAAAVVDPNVGSGSAAPAVEPPKPEPPAPPPEVAKVEPPKPEPPKPEPPKVVPPKPEPPKKAEPKVVAKVEPPKKEPPKKVDPKLRDPKPVKATSWDPLTKKQPKSEIPKPVDPYAEPVKKPDANVAYKTGIQQFARGDANGALSTFKTSLASNPDFAPTWRGIGMVYEKLGKRGQAKTAFKRYLTLSPNAGDAEQIRERMERL